MLVGREEGRHDRDQRGRQGAGRDELEDQVRDAEGREECVKLRGRAELAADDQQPNIAEHAGDEERTGHDQSRPGDGAEGRHGVETRRARGWAPR